jgi:hypothetical protein
VRTLSKVEQQSESLGARNCGGAANSAEVKIYDAKNKRQKRSYGVRAGNVVDRAKEEQIKYRYCENNKKDDLLSSAYRLNAGEV